MPKPTIEDVQECVGKYQYYFGLKSWRIEVSFAVDDQENIGDCVACPEYFKARVAFNLDKLPSLKEMEMVVRHEMLHVVLSPYTEVVLSLSENKKTLELVEEMVVSSMERWPLWRVME